jgi:flagellin
LEAEAIADEFHRLMSTSTYKGKDIFTNVAASERVALGGRAAEMSFGIGKVAYTELYDTERTVSYSGGPNDTQKFHLAILPSDAVLPVGEDITRLEAGVTYEITGVGNVTTGGSNGKPTLVTNTSLSAEADIVVGATFKVTTDFTIGNSEKIVGRALYSDASQTFASVQKGTHYKITGAISMSDDEKGELVAATDLTDISQVVVGAEFHARSTDVAFSAAGTFVGEVQTATGGLTRKIEAIQAKINTARVQAGSQYAAIESSVAYTTDLTAQYELGYNAVNDVNFSMETAHLAKNQILQQAATAMLAQANQGQQSLLQLIQG